jgi:DNA repair exonuclease SbcCD ATPase subunit
MASIKKRGKQLIADIEKLANQLVILTSDLSLLKNIYDLARSVQENIASLNNELTDLKKAGYSAGLADSKALAALDELIDDDAISALEQRLFAAQPHQENSETGEFLQQILEKIEKLYTPLLESIQQLTALPDEE